MSDTKERDSAVKAVAYLSGNREKQPESLKKFFDRIQAFHQKGAGLESAVKQMYKSIEEVNDEMKQLYGSINAVTDIISDELTTEQIKEFSCKITELPNEEQA